MCSQSVGRLQPMVRTHGVQVNTHSETKYTTYTTNIILIMKAILITLGILFIMFVGYLIALHADCKIENKERPQDYDESLF